MRTFGDGHVVLSLAYSLYTATSILLLELQASPTNPQRYTMERLSYCLSALERVKKTNPGMSILHDRCTFHYRENRSLTTKIDSHRDSLKAHSQRINDSWSRHPCSNCIPQRPNRRPIDTNFPPTKIRTIVHSTPILTQHACGRQPP